MQAQTVLDQIEVRADGTIQVRLLKQVIGPEGRIMFSEPHRTALTPLSDLAAQKGAVDSHLMEMGFPPVTDGDWQSVLAQSAAKWTPEVVASWQARSAA